MKIIFLAALLLSSNSFAAAPISIFLGNYTLVKTIAGSCDSVTSVRKSGNDVFAGNFFFGAVNQGTRVYDGDLQISKSTSFTNDQNQLINRTTIKDKITGEISWALARITRKGPLLYTFSRISQAPNIPTACVFREKTLPGN